MSIVTTRPALGLSRRRFLSLSALAVMAYAPKGDIALAAASTPVATEAATSGFLDPSVVHDLSVAFAQDAYEAMIQAYADSNEKEWIEATVSIDGSTYERAGMRLKGNSSLMGLHTVSGSGGQGDRGQGGPDDDLATNDADHLPRSLVDAAADKPERLPWLIRLDKNVDGQHHRGITELVIRSNPSQTSLNEVVALDLLTAAGLASQRAAAARFSVNDREAALRLAIEHPNDAWMATHFSADGLLYKAESTGDWSYRGDDPAAYQEVFDLEAGGTSDEAEDMAPLIAFLEFINASDDATFAAELPERLETEQFATYLAMMELINNHDDIDGPGNNAYLYVGPDRTLFTVVPWDMNLAFGGAGHVVEAGADGAAPQPPDASDPRMIIKLPPSGTPAADAGMSPALGDDVKKPKPNPLVQRFGKAPGFADLTKVTKERLRTDLYESGTAAEVLSRWVGVLAQGASDLVDEETLAAESEQIAEHFTQQ